VEKGRPIFCLTLVCALLLLLAFVCALLLLACVLALLRCILRCSSLRDVEARQQLATDTHRHENQKLLAEILTVKRVVEVIGGVAEDLDGEIFPLAAPTLYAQHPSMCACACARALCIVHCASCIVHGTVRIHQAGSTLSQQLRVFPFLRHAAP